MTFHTLFKVASSFPINKIYSSPVIVNHTHHHTVYSFSLTCSMTGVSLAMINIANKIKQAKDKLTMNNQKDIKPRSVTNKSQNH